MSVTTATPPRAATRPHRGWHSARTALAQAYASTVKMASEARHRYRRPSLIISSFGCADAAAWTTFGLGAGLLALGVSLFVFEMIGDDE
jgi:hypothetical protein